MEVFQQNRWLQSRSDAFNVAHESLAGDYPRTTHSGRESAFLPATQEATATFAIRRSILDLPHSSSFINHLWQV